MYCTGGVRCEKASAFLRQQGVPEVYQLKGGIHRYLEQYPDGGKFRGSNFVFDGRVVQKTDTVVGRCCRCDTAWDQLNGRRVCAVCKTLVLACDPCAEEELFCDQHRSLSDVYRWFLDRYTDEELAAQLRGLAAEEASLGPGKKNRRRTLQRQAERVRARLRTRMNNIE